MGREKKRVVALGFFDGVHLGHSALLEAARVQGEALGALPSALTFDTHPEQLITGARVPLINSLKDRTALIWRLSGIEDVMVIPFDEAFRQMDWTDFVTVLKETFHAVHLICGHNFHFGYRGAGNPQKLREKCRELGMGCDVIREIALDGVPVSSTYIRKLLEAGEMERAGRFLGHPHTLTETVGHGRKLGRTMGVPTINMRIPSEVLIPARGVYATRVFIPAPEADKNPRATDPGAFSPGYTAVTNIGARPTVGAGTRVTVESYILDFAGDLYGKQVRVDFYKRIRFERKFRDVAALREQIQKDAATARAYFAV